MQAGASQKTVLFDDNRFQPPLRGAEGGYVPAGPAADDGEIVFRQAPLLPRAAQLWILAGFGIEEGSARPPPPPLVDAQRKSSETNRSSILTVAPGRRNPAPRLELPTNIAFSGSHLINGTQEHTRRPGRSDRTYSPAHQRRKWKLRRPHLRSAP